MTFSFKRLLSSAVGLVFVLAAPVAYADPQSDAKDLFQKGREHRENNDCGSAAPLFRKAWTVYPAGLGSLRNLAECEETLGHFASARRAWLDLKRALITAPPDQKYEGWDKDADDAAARLKPKVASFVVDVIVSSPEGEAPATEKSGVELSVNGEPVAGTLVGTPLERDPGNYVIRAAHKDAQPVEQTVALSAGDNPRVTLRLTIVPPPPPPVVVEEDHSTRRTVGWVVAGVGAASLVASGVTFLLYQSDKSTIADNCENNVCPRTPDNESAADRGPTMGVLTSILFPVGLVGVGAGLALVLTSGSSNKTAAPTIRFTPSLGGFRLGGTF
ncbi:MAG: hypothetical protein KIT84_05825 [Labilithrix sp.]|nr:hypothetical protein [Labilithrix sp.]MCW5810508.1 hypothetical protein [Labilithrix sp.]